MQEHRRTVCVVLVAGLVVGLLVGLANSPLLHIQRVIVRSSDPSLAQEVARLLKIPPRASILFYPLWRVTQDARTSYRVDTVAVRRATPNLLLVTVTPRQPFAVLNDNTGYTLISREGILLYRAAKPPGELPILSGLTSSRAPLGTQIETERWRWTLEALAGATKAGFRAGLWLDMRNLHRITVRTTEGVTGVLGNVNSLSRKTVIMGRVLEEVRRDGTQVAMIDVSTPETPLWKTK